MKHKTPKFIGYKTQKERIQNTEICSFVTSKKKLFYYKSMNPRIFLKRIILLFTICSINLIGQ